MNLKLLQRLLLVLMIPSLAHCEKQTALNDIKDLKWKNRVLLVHPQQGDSDTLEQLKAAKQQIDERHIIWIITSKAGTTSNHPKIVSDKLATKITKDYFDNKELLAVLIGKDGGVKARYKKLDLDKVFALVDTMPMRQREMKK